jgi:hypothetical protein
MPIASDCASCATSSRPEEFRFRHHVDGFVTTWTRHAHPRACASAHHGASTPFPTGELDQDGDSHTTLDELMAGLLGTAPLKGIVGDAVALHEDAHDDAFDESDSSDDDLDRQIGSPSVSFRHPKVH